MPIVLDRQDKRVSRRNRQINKRGACVPRIGNQFGERDLGVLGYASECADQIVLLE
ncbi:hypothetical protein D3C72_2276760 [compost metagenome]